MVSSYNTRTTRSYLIFLAAPILLLSIFFLFTPYPYASLLVPLGLLFLMASNKRTTFLYYILMFSIPFYRYRTLSEKYEFLKLDFILGFILVLFVVYKIVTSKTLPDMLTETRGLWGWLWLFFLINLVSALLSPYKSDALNNMINPILVSYVYIAINLLFIERRDFEFYLPFIVTVAIAISAAISAIAYAFHIEAFLSPIEQGLRAEGVTSGANNMSFMVIFTLPIAIHFILDSDRGILRIAYLIILVSCIAGLISSFSRGGFLNILFVALLTFIEKKYKITPKNFGMFIAMLGIAITLVVSFVPEEYVERVVTIKKGVEADISTQRRSAYQIAGIKSFLRHPMIGTGPFTFRQVWLDSEEIKNFPFEARPAHNTYMDILVGSGILGLVSFLIILAFCFKSFARAQKEAKDLGDFKLASLIGSYKVSFIGMCVYFLIMSAFEHKLFLLGIALSQIALRMTKEKKNEGKVS